METVGNLVNQRNSGTMEFRMFASAVSHVWNSLPLYTTSAPFLEEEDVHFVTVTNKQSNHPVHTFILSKM